MDPYFFYTYINTLIYNNRYSKYNAIIAFMNYPTIIPEYKLIPEIAIEREHAIHLLNGIMDNQVNNQYVHAQNNNQDGHVIDDEYFNNPPPPPRLRRS